MYILFFAFLVIVGAAPIDKRLVLTRYVTHVVTLGAPAPINNQNTINPNPAIAPNTVPNVPNTPNNIAPTPFNNPVIANTPIVPTPPATPTAAVIPTTSTTSTIPNPPAIPTTSATIIPPTFYLQTSTTPLVPTANPSPLGEPTYSHLSQAQNPSVGYSSQPSSIVSQPSSIPSFTPVFSVQPNSFEDTVDKVWNRFWLTSDGAWNSKDSICGSTSYDSPVVWTQATIAMAIINRGDVARIDLAMQNLYKYQNTQTGGFSASTAGDLDLYSDDNAQVAWAFLAAYEVTKNPQYLQTSKRILAFLVSQWNTQGLGGIIWKYNNPYVSSISTLETALTAMKLHEVNPDPNLVVFAETCMNFMFKYLQDPQDHLFYDGFSDINNINKGKLTYTVGVALSTLARLSESSSDLSWLPRASQLSSAATNPNGAFYNNDNEWNNPIKYVHLLYTGFADIMELVGGQFDGYKQEVLKQGTFVYNYLQDPQDLSMYFGLVDKVTLPMFTRFQTAFKQAGTYKPDPSLHCNDDPNSPAIKDLMDNASAAQILYQLNRMS
jgi:Predicted unsaturated glucuronyl hydrolase involved in regulation of bacterial surface properties, and related proteins